MKRSEPIKDQKLLLPANLTEEDQFYAECNTNGINLVDRVNGKPVYVYPYWIDRPNCNWHSPPVAEDEDEVEVEDESEPESEDEERGNRKGWINRLTAWWKRRDAININFLEES
ncbi:hypothetical protein QUA41_17560 [Microcoleus sp. Pol11C1]|uniref:hypothetical protein n=1 Tax=unclassified Microcoleus TaxID=2642155 RepID=UPI002FD59310